MKKHSLLTSWWLWGLFGGIMLGVLFAQKKGSVLRSQLATVKEKDGAWGQALWLKDEMIAMCQDIGETVDHAWHSKEIQSALHKIAELTKEWLPRIEGVEGENEKV
ncbi:MAG: hypothetical protein HY817_01280 [Candidatus Abawacabacteria bacterium]|nr:hypothetical protein [Candidatus Abawacabacteria bacterium]